MSRQSRQDLSFVEAIDGFSQDKAALEDPVVVVEGDHGDGLFVVEGGGGRRGGGRGGLGGQGQPVASLCAGQGQ